MSNVSQWDIIANLARVQTELWELQGKANKIKEQLSPIEKEIARLREQALKLMLEYPINPDENFDINQSVKVLDIDQMAMNDLNKNSIYTVADLLLYTNIELIARTTLTRRTLNVVVEALHKKGWTLWQTEDTLKQYGYKKREVFSRE